MSNLAHFGLVKLAKTCQFDISFIWYSLFHLSYLLNDWFPWLWITFVLWIKVMIKHQLQKFPSGHHSFSCRSHFQNGFLLCSHKHALRSRIDDDVFYAVFLFWKKFLEVGTFKIITNSRNLSEDNFQPLKMASAAIYWGESGKGQKRPCSRVLRRLTPSKGFQIQKTWILWKETGSSSIVSKVSIFLHLWSDLAVFDNLWQVFFSIFSFSRQFWEKLKLRQ